MCSRKLFLYSSHHLFFDCFPVSYLHILPHKKYKIQDSRYKMHCSDLSYFHAIYVGWPLIYKYLRYSLPPQVKLDSLLKFIVLVVIRITLIINGDYDYSKILKKLGFAKKSNLLSLASHAHY